MSIEKSNKLIKDQKGEKGFSTALLLNFSPFENSFRELSDGIENVRLNTSASAIQNEGTRMINNLLTSDLLEGIDYSSPYHQNHKSNEDKVEDDNILENCGNDSVLHSSEEEYSDDEEIISNHSNTQEKKESNSILKEIEKRKSKMNSSSKLPNDSKHNSNNQLMMNNNKGGGRSQFAKKPPEDLYSYYGGTSKYLSETFMNGNQNKTDMNHNRDLYSINLNANANVNGMMGFNKDLYSNYVNEMMYQQQINNYPFGYYNCMNMNMGMNTGMGINNQMYHNYSNRSNNKQLLSSQIPDDLNYQMSTSNHQDQGSFHQSDNWDSYPYMGVGQSNGLFLSQYLSNPNANQITKTNININYNTNANNLNVRGQKKRIQHEIGKSNVIPQQTYINNTNPINQKKKKKKKEKKAKQNDEYLIEMFGRIGWICDQCNNFNYETRNKCNRCNVPKSPKKVSKLRKQQEANKKQQEHHQQNEDGIQPKKVNEKKANDRKGMWNCICCRNLNFSFRTVCNRCKLPKEQNVPLENSQSVLHVINSNNTQKQYGNGEESYFNDINVNQLIMNNRKGNIED